MTPKHPIRKQTVRVFKEVGADFYLARFGTGREFPIIFSGANEHEARQAAEDFRADTLEKHEAAYVARQVALEKARAAKTKKAAS